MPGTSAIGRPRCCAGWLTPEWITADPIETEAILQPRYFSKRPTVALEVRVVKGSGGGPDKTILNSPRFLEASGYRTICAYMHPPEDPGFEQLRRKARRWQAPLVSVPDRGFWDWKVIPQLLNLCRRERVAIWHGHEYKSNLLGLLLRRFWPMHLVTTVHGWVHHTSRTSVYYAVDRWCLPRYDRVLCVSEDLHQLSLDCGVAPDHCLLVKNAIDTDEFRRELTSPRAKSELGLDGNRFLIGAVGRLSPEKGFDVLLRALARVVAEGEDIGLLLVGEGEQRDELETLASSLGLGDRVHLAGFQAEPRRHFEAMDAYALSSIREGLPNVVLEALALEVPLVATRIAGVPQVIEDGHNGLLVEPNSVGSLATALLRLVRDRQLCRRLAQAGRQTVEQNYSFRTRMGRIASIYDELLSRGHQAPTRRERMA